MAVAFCLEKFLNESLLPMKSDSYLYKLIYEYHISELRRKI